MSELQQNSRNMAVLIDAENITHKGIDHAIKAVRHYGNITYSCAYGDWSKLPNWKPTLQKKCD